ncbi:RNase H family protein [Anaerosacchariphilus polymeriproducens]|uniref:RNase H family protein n=1 Tax=Anaerosacchariphilus polymeriproducens TaxID=1812858 RepID=UPI00228762A1|nr:RNase H family protein [Anaerosacchariphilus polymeriproducens]
MYEVKIFIETTIKGPRIQEGWYAAVVEYKKKSGEVVTREIFEQEKETTYHRTTLLASIKALNLLNAECFVEIHTDSTFMINNVEHGNVDKWKVTGWVNSKGEEVKNKELWQQLAAHRNRHDIQFIKERRNEYSVWMHNEIKRLMEDRKHV